MSWLSPTLSSYPPLGTPHQRDGIFQPPIPHLEAKLPYVEVLVPAKHHIYYKAKCCRPLGLESGTFQRLYPPPLETVYIIDTYVPLPTERGTRPFKRIYSTNISPGPEIDEACAWDWDEIPFCMPLASLQLPTLNTNP
ncbi:hypothetical protein L804_00609 [Cryptococcus deuterogattii 2001/935-1]|nr:hypothetical protein I352_01428 [Cryptococcus deuterogattii MMRL2647]KIS02348.1 hypothetical protein L804_00609 [Cryptococcus deuterogattii 2001/935-1]